MLRPLSILSLYNCHNPINQSIHHAGRGAVDQHRPGDGEHLRRHAQDEALRLEFHRRGGNGIGKACDGHQRTRACHFRDVIIKAEPRQQCRQHHEAHGRSRSGVGLIQPHRPIPIHKNLAQGTNQATDPECVQAVPPDGRLGAHIRYQSSVFPFFHFDPSGFSLPRLLTFKHRWSITYLLRVQLFFKKEVFFVHHDRTALTEGPIWKNILLFAFPVFLGNVFQQFYNAFDSWAVGNFIGENALAAVSSSGSLIFMLVGFFNGVAMGAGVIIARYFGAKDYDSMRRAIHTDVAFGLTAGAILTVVGVSFTPTILRWMGTPAEVLPNSIYYFRFYFCGAIFTVMYNIFVGILHAVGDSRHPLYYLMISTCVNIVLDLLFVGVLFRDSETMGVGSAAMATTISQGISALLCFLRLVRVKEPYQLKVKEIRFHWQSLKDIIRFGLPSGIQNSVISIANVFVQTNVNSFGKAAMAGHGSYAKIEGFAFLPVTCFMQALSTFVGQKLGAHKHDRVKKGIAFALLCSTMMAELIGVLSYTFAPQLISIFNKTPEVIDYGVRYMRVVSLFYCLLAFSHCIAGVMRGAGKATVPMVVMLSCWCVLRVTYINVALRFVDQLETVAWAYPITWSCSSIVFLIYFLKADWIHNFDRIDAKAKSA